MKIMKQMTKKILALLLAVSMICPQYVLPAAAEEASDVEVITNEDVIIEDGTYQLAADATGTITISEGVKNVTIIGNGAEWDSNPASEKFGTITSTANINILIDCTAAPGITLTLKDMYISNSGVSHNLVDFSGKGNTLIYDGTIILDHDNGANGYAAIHVGTGTSLTIYGTTGSSAYLYKSEQAAGIGADNNEACGTITFGKKDGANDFYFYMKGSKQGAVIGNGANCPSTPGDITFNCGVYNLIAIARGALIGGSAGAASEAAGNVYINGGLLNLNVDFSGAAIGGGGFDAGNDKGGGNVYMNGGSVRTYIDTNAVSSWSGYGVTKTGVNDVAITANKVNSDGEAVYMLTIDTADIDADTYTVKVDDETYYVGGNYEYCYVNEDLDRDADNGLVSTSPLGTPGNWGPLTETNLYLYVTGTNHTITINDKKFTASWDLETKSFSMDEYQDDLYEITSSVSPEDAGMLTFTVNGEKTAYAAEGDEVTVAVTANGGYVADGALTVIRTADGSAVEVTDNTFTMPAEAVTVSQNFANVAKDVTVSLKTITTGLGGRIAMPITVTGDIAALGVTKLTLNVSYDANNGNHISHLEALQTEGSTMTLDYTSGRNTPGSATITITADEGTTLTAGEIGKFLVCVGQNKTWVADGESYFFNITSATLSDADGNTIKDVDLTYENAKINVDYSVSYSITTVGEHGNVVVKYSENEITEYNFAEQGNIWLSISCTDVEEGWAVDYYIVKNDLTGVEKKITYGGFTVVEYCAPITITAYFAPTHTIAVDNSKSTNGTISCSTSAQVAGKNVSVSYTADEGYAYGTVYWSYVDSETNEVVEKSQRGYSFTMPDADVTVWMEFEALKNVEYTLAVEDSGYYDGTPTTAVRAGNDVDFIPVYNEGYHLSAIEYSADGGETWTAATRLTFGYITVTRSDGTAEFMYKYRVTVPNSDIVIRSTFEKDATLKIDDIENGQVTITRWPENNTMTAKPGKTMYYTVTPDEGYRLIELYYEDAEGNKTDIRGNYFGFPTTGDCTLHAVFSNSTEADLTIGTAQELVDYAAGVNAGTISTLGRIIKLTADIDMEGYSWTPISTNYSDPFTGIFDGDGHTVSGLTNALFYYNEGTVKNVTVSGEIAASSGSYTAGIALRSDKAAVYMNCINRCNIKATSNVIAGGIVGYVSADIKIIECANYGTISSGNAAGGMVGTGTGTIVIERCANYGDITVVYADTYATPSAAGMFGRLGSTSINLQITDCYNMGNICASSTNPYERFEPCAAGMFGLGINIGTVSSALKNKIIVTNCYNAGEVKREGTYSKCNHMIGEIVPEYATNVSGNIVSGTVNVPENITMTNCYGTEVSAEEMQTEGFAAKLGSAYNADAEDGSINNGYPVLKWQGGREVYAVTAAESEKYTVEAAAGIYAGAEEDITFTVTPAENHTILSVSVTIGGEAYEVSAEGETYTIPAEAVTGNVVITVEAMRNLEILSQPSDYEGALKDTAVFAVEAAGDELTYQWQYKNVGTTIWKNSSQSGNQTAELNVPVTAARDGQAYRCVVTDTYGNQLITEEVVIHVNTAITLQPVDYTSSVGEKAAFTVKATGIGLSYQWQYQNAGTTTWRNSSQSGNQTAALNVPITEARDGQKYRCIVTDANGNLVVSETAMIIVKNIDITIITQPSDYEGAAGETAVFAVRAEGEGLTYQWQYCNAGCKTWKNSSQDGSQSSTVNVPITAARNGQKYRCLITNANGDTVVSEAGTIVVAE